MPPPPPQSMYTVLYIIILARHSPIRTRHHYAAVKRPLGRSTIIYTCDHSSTLFLLYTIANCFFFYYPQSLYDIVRDFSCLFVRKTLSITICILNMFRTSYRARDLLHQKSPYQYYELSLMFLTDIPVQDTDNIFL